MGMENHWKSWNRHAIRHQAAPIFVWLLACAATGYLLFHQSQRYVMRGIAQGEKRIIASVGGGTLRSVPVELHDQVREGQIVALLDDQSLVAELAIAASEIDRLQSELIAMGISLQLQALDRESTHLSEARDFAVDYEAARLKELELVVQIEADRITIDYLEFYRDWMQDLAYRKLASPLEAELAKSDYLAKGKTLATSESMLAQARLDTQAAQERATAFTSLPGIENALDTQLGPFREAITVQKRFIESLQVQRANLALRSPIDGSVAELFVDDGEAIQPCAPIMTIYSNNATDVIAWADPAQVGTISTGDPVTLIVQKANRQQEVIQTQVTSAGPAILPKPDQLWISPTMPEWGWPIQIAASDLQLIAGQIVGVK